MSPAMRENARADSSFPWLGTLPPSWEVRRLGALGALSKGNGGSKADNRENGVPVVRYGELYTQYDRVISEPHSYISEDDVPQYTALPKGSIVFAGSGEDPEDIGRSALSLLEMPAYVGGDTVVFTPRRDRVEPLYLAYVLESRPLKAFKAIRSTGFTVVHISAGRLKTLPIPLPPIDEQRLIADFLDRETAQIDALIAKQEQFIGLLSERRYSLIVRGVTRGLSDAPTKPSTLTWVDEVPAHWTVANIRRFAAMKTGHTPSRSNPEYWEHTYIPWFTLADVWQLRDGRHMYLDETQNTISDLGLANSSAELLPAGTVALSRTASVGFSGVMPQPMATSQDFWNWVCGPLLAPEYLVYLFRAMRNEFNALMIGSTHQTIYQPVAASIRIPVPPVDEQREIVGHLERHTARIDALIAKATELIALAKERRAALITEAVTGRINVSSGRAA